MHSVKGLVFICILCAYVIGFEAKLYDESDWLDPNNLIDYDPITKTMKSRQNSMVNIQQFHLVDHICGILINCNL